MAAIKGALLPIFFVVAGGVLYHVSQKAVPRGLNPLWGVIAAYVTGILICLVLLAVLPGEGLATGALRHLNLAVFGIGGGAVLFEVGFMLVYRAGVGLGIASVIGNICVALLLLPIGVIFLGEKLTMRTLAGIACCLVGLLLLARK